MEALSKLFFLGFLRYESNFVHRKNELLYILRNGTDMPAIFFNSRPTSIYKLLRWLKRILYNILLCIVSYRLKYKYTYNRSWVVIYSLILTFYDKGHWHYPDRNFKMFKYEHQSPTSSKTMYRFIYLYVVFIYLKGK